MTLHCPRRRPHLTLRTDADLARAIDRVRRALAVTQLARDPWDDHSAEATPQGLALGVVDELLGAALEALRQADEAP
jgi:hypothetical protein